MQGYAGYMCTVCYETSDHYFTQCPSCGITEEEFNKREAAKKKDKYPNAKYTCKNCSLRTIDEYYFCPRCGKDEDGLTEDQTKLLYKDRNLSDYIS